MELVLTLRKESQNLAVSLMRNAKLGKTGHRKNFRVYINWCLFQNTFHYLLDCLGRSKLPDFK